MKYEIDGISSPLGGVSWSKNTTAKEHFRDLLLFLESKRILVNPIEMELKHECIESVLDIKSKLTSITKDIPFKGKDIDIIRILVDVCNKFLDTVKDDKIPHLIYKKDNISWIDYQLDTAMKDFRTAFREQIRVIEDKYKLCFNKNIPKEF